MKGFTRGRRRGEDEGDSSTNNNNEKRDAERERERETSGEVMEGWSEERRAAEVCERVGMSGVSGVKEDATSDEKGLG